MKLCEDELTLPCNIEEGELYLFEMTVATHTTLEVLTADRADNVLLALDFMRKKLGRIFTVDIAHSAIIVAFTLVMFKSTECIKAYRTIYIGAWVILRRFSDDVHSRLSCGSFFARFISRIC